MGFSHRMPWAAGIRVELAAHSSAARRLVAVARIEIGWVRIGHGISLFVNYRDGEHRGLSLPGGDGGVD